MADEKATLEFSDNRTADSNKPHVFYSISQAAKKLGLSRQYVNTQVRNGKYPWAVRIIGVYRHPMILMDTEFVDTLAKLREEAKRRKSDLDEFYNTMETQ